MRSHHRGEPRARVRREGDQLHCLEPRERVLQHRQGQVAVLQRVAMPREVLAAGGHPTLLQTLGQCDAHAGDLLWPGAEAPVTDDRIGRVAVDVEDRGKVPIEARGPQLEGEQPPHATRDLHVAAAADGAHRRKGGVGRPPEPRHPPAFLVHRHRERPGCP